MLNLDAINNALSTIEEVGKGNLTFEVNGIEITIRLLFPEEEQELQRYSSSVYAEDEDEGADSSKTIEYLNKFRLGLLSYAIIEIAGQDLRDKFVETGVVLSNGVLEKKPKHTVMRSVIQEKWSSQLRDMIFRKYTELQEKVERESEKAIKYEPSDIDSEIKRLEEKVQLLQDRKEQESYAQKEKLGVENLEPISDFEEEKEPIQVPQQPVQQQPVQQQPVQQPVQQQPVQQQPVQAQEDSVSNERKPFLPPTATPPPQYQQQVINNVQPNQIEDSLVNNSNLASTVESENLRLAQARYNTGSLPQHPLMRPPHASAAEASLQYESSLKDVSKTIHQYENGEEIDVYQLPPQLVENVNPLLTRDPDTAVLVNQKVPSSLNPRFRSPKK